MGELVGQAGCIVGCCHPSTFSNSFSLETTGPFITKFRISLGWENIGLDHMTNRVTIFSDP